MEVREGGGRKMQFCFEDAEDHVACCVGGCHEGSEEVLRGCDRRGVLEGGAIEDRIFRYLVIPDELIPVVRGKLVLTLKNSAVSAAPSAVFDPPMPLYLQPVLS